MNVAQLLVVTPTPVYLLSSDVIYVRTMQTTNLLWVLAMLALSCGCSARTLASSSSSCGAQGALCGASLATQCQSSGQGYCQPGFFCGWTFSDTDRKTVCMLVPAKCGQPGESCCPGNAKAAITDPKQTPKPTCGSGSYCFYTPTPDASGWSSPPHSSPAGPLLGESLKTGSWGHMVPLAATIGLIPWPQLTDTMIRVCSRPNMQ